MYISTRQIKKDLLFNAINSEDVHSKFQIAKYNLKLDYTTLSLKTRQWHFWSDILRGGGVTQFYKF